MSTPFSKGRTLLRFEFFERNGYVEAVVRLGELEAASTGLSNDAAFANAMEVLAGKLRLAALEKSLNGDTSNPLCLRLAAG